MKLSTEKQLILSTYERCKDKFENTTTKTQSHEADCEVNGLVATIQLEGFFYLAHRGTTCGPTSPDPDRYDLCISKSRIEFVGENGLNVADDFTNELEGFFYEIEE